MKEIVVLLADDSQIIREKLFELFTSEPGILLLEPAVDGEDTIDKVNSFKPDILILDLSMPKFSGFEVLKYVNKNSPLTKSIILSNHSGDTFRKKAEKLGCYSFYDKSTDFELVVNEVVRLRNENELMDLKN